MNGYSPIEDKGTKCDEKDDARPHERQRQQVALADSEDNDDINNHQVKLSFNEKIKTSSSSCTSSPSSCSTNSSSRPSSPSGSSSTSTYPQGVENNKVGVQSYLLMPIFLGMMPYILSTVFGGMSFWMEMSFLALIIFWLYLNATVPWNVYSLCVWKRQAEIKSLLGQSLSLEEIYGRWTCPLILEYTSITVLFITPFVAASGVIYFQEYYTQKYGLDFLPTFNVHLFILAGLILPLRYFFGVGYTTKITSESAPAFRPSSLMATLPPPPRMPNNKYFTNSHTNHHGDDNISVGATDDINSMKSRIFFLERAIIDLERKNTHHHHSHNNTDDEENLYPTVKGSSSSTPFLPSMQSKPFNMNSNSSERKTSRKDDLLLYTSLLKEDTEMKARKMLQTHPPSLYRQQNNSKNGSSRKMRPRLIPRVVIQSIILTLTMWKWIFMTPVNALRFGSYLFSSTLSLVLREKGDPLS